MQNKELDKIAYNFDSKEIIQKLITYYNTDDLVELKKVIRKDFYKGNFDILCKITNCNIAELMTSIVYVFDEKIFTPKIMQKVKKYVKKNRIKVDSI